MAEVHIVDIDGEQWDIKDQPLTTRVAALEEKATKNFEYSTAEQKIGKWVDGKDLYRLIITGNTSIREALIYLTDKNIEDITKINGVCTANGQYVFPIPYYVLDSIDQLKNTYTYFVYDKSGKFIYLAFGTSGYFDTVKYTVEIEYIKNS